MKKLIVLPLILLLLACAKSDDPVTTVDLESILGVAQSDSPLGGGVFFKTSIMEMESVNNLIYFSQTIKALKEWFYFFTVEVLLGEIKRKPLTSYC